jgi:dienelactone hydrolase
VFVPVIGSLLGAAALVATEPTYAVKVEPDVVYGTAEGYWTEAPEDFWGLTGRLFRRKNSRHSQDLTLDIYLPADDKPAGPRPLMLMMHGGAYLFGSKTEKGQVEWCRYFASLGYVAVSINYRLGFSLEKEAVLHAEKDATEDACMALRYLLGREDLRIDPGYIYLAGTSAGAATALAVAYGSNEFRGQIRAIANLWGFVHDLDILKNASVPILSFQSEKDPVVPYREGRPMMSPYSYGTLSIHQKAVSLGIPSEHHPCPEKGHRLHLDKEMELTPLFYEIRDAMVRFFAKY